MSAEITRSRSSLEVLTHRLSPRSLRAEVLSRRGRLAMAAGLVTRAAASRLGLARERLVRAAGFLQSLSPLAVLERGYAICHDAASGAVLIEAQTQQEGRDVRVRLFKGALLCEVRKAVIEDS